MPSETNQSLLSALADELQDSRRFIPDSPIRTGVWYHYLALPEKAQPVLLIPLRSASAGELCVTLNQHLEELGKKNRCIYNQNSVYGEFSVLELISIVLPFSRWWQQVIEPHLDTLIALGGPARGRPQHIDRKAVERDLDQARAGGRESGLPADILWCIRLFGIFGRATGRNANNNKNGDIWPSAAEQLRHATRYFKAIKKNYPTGAPTLLFAVSRNRTVTPCLTESVRSVKADATREVFDVDCQRLTWAILDTGIDRNHPAFTDPAGNVRVTRSLDFTRLGDMLRLASSAATKDRDKLRTEFGLNSVQARKFTRSILAGDSVDWELVEQALVVDPQNADYFSQLDPHGTQVAGILAAREHQGQPNVLGDAPKTYPGGLCPDIKLLDLRVISSGSAHEYAEFQIMSALQYIRDCNRDKDKPQIHGANLSLSLPHSVIDYGCGQTPVCEESDRLVASGVVVVAAAGNYGFDHSDISGPAADGGYRDLSITDPGNADSVITVGATHGKYPHRYGVSYFSSRGPTGDGRVKPDLVAPGESIYCPSKNHTYDVCHGTSMAAPHVSGAAALLMARHGGLIGKPDRIKEVLCNTATDLNRSSDGQGRGLVDTLRAMQSL